MRDIRPAVQRLLITREGKFSTRHLAYVLSISKSRAGVHLARLVETKELERVGEGRNGSFRKGPSWGVQMRGAPKTRLWNLLARGDHGIAYVELVRIGSVLTRREQVTNAFEWVLGNRFVVVDFDGVEKISNAFADELLVLTPRHFPVEVVPINMCDSVRATARRSLLLEFGASVAEHY